MASSNTNNGLNEPPRVYTIYPGVHGNSNYGFYAGQPQAPPPKYEDVMSGRPQEQHSVHPTPILEAYRHDLGPSNGVILVAPAYKPSKTQKTLGLLFTIVFLIAVVSVLIKVLKFGR